MILVVKRAFKKKELRSGSQGSDDGRHVADGLLSLSSMVGRRVLTLGGGRAASLNHLREPGCVLLGEERVRWIKVTPDVRWTSRG